jgi:tetratricopeptide (TPR) repeat protein
MINTGSAAIRKLEQKGREHQQLRQYSAASSCYRQSLMMAREMGHLPGESTAMASLRRLRRVLVRAAAVAHSPAQAVEYSSTALDAARLVEDRVGEKAALSTLAELYGKLGQFDAAIQHMERALAIAEEDGGGVGGDVASGAPKLRRALHLLCLGAERAQEEEAADRAFRALISTKPRAIEVAAAAAAVPELEPEPELRAHPPSDPGPARSAAVTQRARAWEALESPGRDHHAHALIKGRRAWLTTPSTQQQQQQQQQVQLHSPRSHRSDDGGDVAADVRRPRPPAPPALDNSSSSSVFGSSSTRGPPSSLSSPSAPGTPLSLSASSASPSGHSQQHSAHESLESMLEEKRTLASRWHPPMVLPAFYWSSHYYHSLALLCADNTNSNSKSGNGGGDADVGVELTQYSHSQYKQALSEEGAALRRKLERSAAKAIKAAAADGSGSSSSSSSSSSSGRKEGLSTAALARRARKAGIATERIDAALQLSSSSSASSSGSDGGSAIGVVGAGATASSTGSIVVSSASANAALIDLLVEQHVGQADAFMAKYFNQ